MLQRLFLMISQSMSLTFNQLQNNSPHDLNWLITLNVHAGTHTNHVNISFSTLLWCHMFWAVWFLKTKWKKYWLSLSSSYHFILLLKRVDFDTQASKDVFLWTNCNKEGKKSEQTPEKLWNRQKSLSPCETKPKKSVCVQSIYWSINIK